MSRFIHSADATRSLTIPAAQARSILAQTHSAASWELLPDAPTDEGGFFYVHSTERHSI